MLGCVGDVHVEELAHRLQRALDRRRLRERRGRVERVCRVVGRRLTIAVRQDGAHATLIGSMRRPRDPIGGSDTPVCVSTGTHTVRR